MKQKKIWYISKYAACPKYSSAGRQFSYSKYFSKMGYDVSLIYSRSSTNDRLKKFDGLYKKDIIENVKCIALNGPKIELGFNLKRIISWILFELNLFKFIIKSSKKPDVAIVSSLSLLTVFNGLILKTFYGTKFIFEVRDIWPLTLLDIGGYSLKNPFIKFLDFVENLGYKNADIIVGTMPNLKKHVEKKICSDFVCKYMPTGFDNEINNWEYQKWNFPEGKFIVGYAGSIGKANQVEDILYAAEMLQKQKRIFFVILGDGPSKKYLQVKYSFLTNVKWFPRVDRKSVNSFLKSCDLLINPWKKKDIYRYGISPNKWLDYMYSGKPVIVSYSGYKNIINEAECGDFIEAENPSLLSEKIYEYSQLSKKELLKIGERGKKFLYKKLSYSVLAEEYSKLF